MKTIIILIVAIAGAAFILGGCRPKSPEHIMNRVFKDITNKLNLSESQKTQLLSIKNELLEKGREMHEDRENIHKEISELILSDRIDPEEVKAKGKKKHAKMEELLDLTVDRLAEFHATLSPEQKRSLVELMEKHHKRRMKHFSPPFP